MVLRRGLFLLAVSFLGVFFIFPLLAILRRALLPAGQLDLAGISASFTPGIWRVIWFSAWQAALSTVLTIVAALPAAYIFARYTFPGKALLRSLAAVPFVLPTVVVALAFGSLLGERGLINRWLMDAFNQETALFKLDDSLPLVLLAHVFFNYSIVLRIVGGYWASADPRLEEAAQVLGASRWRIWWEIRLPLVLPALLAAALLVFMFTFAAFGTVLLLGGPRLRTIEVEIYEQALNQLNLTTAAVLSLLQILVTLALTAIYTRLQRRAAQPQDVRRAVAQRISSWPQRLLVAGVLGVMLLILVTPLIALAVSALTVGQQWSIEYFRLLMVNQRGSYVYITPQQALANSLGFAALATGLALLFGIPAAYGLARPQTRLTRWLDPLFMLPLGTSAVTLGFGYIISFRAYQLDLGLVTLSTPDLRTTRWIVPLAHTLLALPFVTRTMLPALRRFNPRLREAAASLGASPVRVFWEIDLPLLAPAMLVAATFAWTVSLGDFGAALILARPEHATLPVVIYRLLGQPGPTNYGQALAMSTLLMAVTLVSFGLIERLRVAGDEL